MLLVLGLLAVASISVWHLLALQRSGQPVFWLAELWAPVGVLSIGLVSCLEYLLPPSTALRGGDVGRSGQALPSHSARLRKPVSKRSRRKA
ncbi:MAG TPA: hypothetical protein VNZ67_07065 [bacterium]|nr:hypothetical protein [bacterium]